MITPQGFSRRTSSKWPDFADLSQPLGTWPISTASEVWFRPEQMPR